MRVYNGVSLEMFSWQFSRMAMYALANPDNDAFIVRKHTGRNPDVDAAAAEDIWQTGGTRTETTAASVVTVASGDANDTAAGSGARTVTIHGLDANYAVQSETVTMNGVSNVTTTATFRHVNYAVVATAGSGQTNAGAITFTVDSKTQATMAANASVTENSHYTIPAGYTGFIYHVDGSASRAGATGTDTIARLFISEITDTGVILLSDYHEVNDLGGSFDIKGLQPLKFEEKHTIKAVGDSETNNTVMDFNMRLLMINNALLG